MERVQRIVYILTDASLLLFLLQILPALPGIYPGHTHRGTLAIINDKLSIVSLHFGSSNRARADLSNLLDGLNVTFCAHVFPRRYAIGPAGSFPFARQPVIILRVITSNAVHARNVFDHNGARRYCYNNDSNRTHIYISRVLYRVFRRPALTAVLLVIPLKRAHPTPLRTTMYAAPYIRVNTYIFSKDNHPFPPPLKCLKNERESGRKEKNTLCHVRPTDNNIASVAVGVARCAMSHSTVF